LNASGVVSALVITLNEEKNISECLDSLAWTSEIIVVDSLSSDRTGELCKRPNVRFVQREWPGYGPQKNFGIGLARGEWVLIVDADERVSPDLKNEILDAVHGGTGPNGFEIPRRNYFYGKWIRHGGAYPDYQLRLFRRGSGRYDETPVHERFLLDGPAGYLKTPLDHYTERRISDHFGKFDRYTTLAARHELEKNRITHWWNLSVNPALTFLKIYVSKMGFLDGVHGLIYSCFVAMYTFVKYAKLWEMKEN